MKSPYEFDASYRMLTNLVRSSIAALLLISGAIDAKATAQSTDDAAAPAAEVTGDLSASETAVSDSSDSAEDTGDQTGQTKTIQLTEAAKAALEAYQSDSDSLKSQMMDMRALHMLYQNGIERNPETERLFREQRDLVRAQLRKTFRSALKLFLNVPEKDAATFLVTMVQNHVSNGIYDEDTLQAAGYLLNAGQRQLFLLYAAGRGAVVTGDFKTARRIYELMAEKDREKIDDAFHAQLDLLESQWIEEQERRTKDAAGELPRVRFETSKGTFVAELFLDEAPSTVSHFITLVEEGFYDGLDFYQVVDDLLALTGDPGGDGSGGSGKYLIDENEREGARNGFRGSLMMAKLPAGEGAFIPNTASSQFAILFMPAPTVRETQTVFGRVIEGMDVVSSFRRVDPNEKKGKNTLVLPPDRIFKAEVIRRPDALPSPVYYDHGR
ncbi:MAG: peptidylprolyl isomerase [Planctomycetota bacterium]